MPRPGPPWLQGRQPWGGGGEKGGRREMQVSTTLPSPTPAGFLPQKLKMGQKDGQPLLWAISR